MSNKLYEESAIQDIANAIRSKSGTSDTFKVAEMGDAVRAIPQGGVTPTGTISITSNGTHDVTQYASASVNVPTSEPSGNITITANGTGIDVANYATATVAVPGPSGSQTYTQNGTYDVSAIAQAVINVSGGGGMPSWIVSGDFTPSEDIESYIVTHNKGKLPIIALVYAEDKYNPAKSMHIVGVGDLQTNGSLAYATQFSSGQTPPNVGVFNVSHAAITEFDNTKVTFATRSGFPFKTGYKYKYFIFFEEA